MTQLLGLRTRRPRANQNGTAGELYCSIGPVRKASSSEPPFFGDKRMSSITTSDIRAYVAKRHTDGWLVKARRHADELDQTGPGPPPERHPVAAGEINRELTVQKRMFSLAMQAGKLRYKPHIPMLRENNVRAGFFEPEHTSSC